MTPALAAGRGAWKGGGNFIGRQALRNIDLSSWPAILTSVLGLALFALIGVGIRLLAMFTIQQRRERQNRQINERLKVLIAAYKVLGGSFTGSLLVDPTHLGDLRRAAPPDATATFDLSEPNIPGSDRARRVRDAVEAALSDIVLLGTDRQVRLAAAAATELAAGRPVHVGDLVVSLRDFIREALDLEAIPAELIIPAQGPARPAASGGRGSSERGKGGGGGGGAGGDGGGMGGGMGGVDDGVETRT
jgi:uncharacterized membrane protein YgcG